MIIDGETYACESCIRGHRSRNCQHNDRPLQHIKAKGRPVSQCNHCRSERKNRSAHVKCQCGKRASEGGSGQKCRCATKKSPKQEPTKLGDISDQISELASPASILNMTSPAQLSSAGTDFQWSDAATPASNFTSLDGLAQFDPDAWISSPQLDSTMGFGGGGSMDQSAAMPAAGAESGTGLFSSPQQQQQFPMDVPDFASMNEWPAMDDEATKQLLAMMDTSAGLDLNGFDVSTLSLMGGNSNAEPTFGLDFAQQQQQQPLPQPATDNAKPACNSKREEGCGPCCG
ncbi:Copper fist DNA binding domain protein [Akanthomyces lecanii RCEF 1005]|uniref:Copper fist DNA binding domain protein n=1 Tax=Akanthomyces lecanii RCEF 1005 TaxID=1081108 RepID=A0A162N563_CORDF|nr:Copper fist DNA binding domain protein [Akanthomyces lecanii RCEF 1005]